MPNASDWAPPALEQRDRFGPRYPSRAWARALSLPWVVGVLVSCKPFGATEPTPRAPGSAASDARKSDQRKSSEHSARTATARYHNPVLPGTNPDPSICRVGDDYYLVTSSFEYFPGVPIYHSKDLVHWRQIGHVLTRESQANLANTKSSKGIFAPTLRYHEGIFYMVTTNVEGGGSFYVTARDPAGPWSDPIWVEEPVFTMDPSLFFDDDGKVYYTRHGEGRDGAVFQAEIDIATGELKQAPQRIWDGTGGIWPEGPHLYKINGLYTLILSEGGTSYGHRVTVARSSSPWGPFEPHPSNPILTHEHLPNHPIQATGHADLVQTQAGQWWMVFLGIRPSTPGHHHIGRETFLAPVQWDDAGWPIVNDEQPVDLEMPATSLPPPHPWRSQPAREDFESGRLGFEWNYLRSPRPGDYSLSERPGFLRLHGTTASLSDVASPTVVLQRQRHHRVRATAEVHFAPKPGQVAGLVIRGNEQNHYQLLVRGHEVANELRRRIVFTTRINGETRQVAERAIGEGPLVLGVEGFADRYEFFVEQGSRRLELGDAPTVPFAYERTQSFTGAFIGLYAHAAPAVAPAVADFAWFEYQPL